MRYYPELIEKVSGGQVCLRHTMTCTSQGRYYADGEAGHWYTSFRGQNDDGTTFTVKDAGGQFGDDRLAAEEFADELNEDHEAFLAWLATLTPADRVYLDSRASH